MDGLECSEIRMSDVCDTTTLRFDSDYYKKEYLEIEQFICKNRDKFVTIESQGLQVDASAFYPSLEPYYNTGTIPFVRVADVKDQIEYNACVNIPEMGEEFRTLHMCYPKGAAPLLAHDFAKQSVVCYTLCRRCRENAVAA